MSKTKNVNVLLLSAYRELAEAFIEPATSQDGGQLVIGDSRLSFDLIAGDPSLTPDFEDHVKKANAIAIVIRFLDVLSLDKIRLIYRYLPNEISVPVGLFLLRDKGELDFKISCPSCGQKLWLRDHDVGKRGRCPNCKKPFIIQSQPDHVKTQLMIPQSIPIVTLTRGEVESLKLALAQLFDSVSVGIKPTADAELMSEALKNATMPIQVQEG